MRMKMSKSQFVSSYRSWLLTSALALMVLLTWSKLYDTQKSSSFKNYVHLQPRRAPSKGPDAPPILAYWILGTKGENKRIIRLLKAIYHPRNVYLLQLDSAASYRERLELSYLAQSEGVFEEFGNVDVVGKSYAVNPMAASGLTAVLHAAALLLRLRDDWDWFLPLSTSDYPILPQDDVLYAFSSLPKDVIFMGYYNATSMDKRQKAMQIVVDPSLHLKKKSPIIYAAETREKPDTFEIFGGSPWMFLTRNFLEHCVNGMDNLPRKLLMYFNNVHFPLQTYFQTVLCNTPLFQNTILVNNDLRLTIHTTNLSVLPQAIFARLLAHDKHQLQEIDEKLLKRGRGRFVPGKWCNGTGLVNRNAPSYNATSKEYWSISGDIDAVQPTVGGIKLQEFFLRFVNEKKMASSQCRSYALHETTN